MSDAALQHEIFEPERGEPQGQAVTMREDTQPLPVSEAGAVIQMIERAARDPAVDIDKFERLMAMSERMRDREAEHAFNAAMSEAQAEMPRVVRDAENDHTKSRYATLDAISKAIAPIYTRHGFSLSFGTEEAAQGFHRIFCIASHSAGHSRRYHADLPADVAGSQGKANKTAIQGFGSTMSYGRRYLTLMIFNIAVGDDDNDGNATGDAELISEEQVKNLQRIADEVGADVPKMCDYLGVDSLPAIPAARYEDAVRALSWKKRVQSKGARQ